MSRCLLLFFLASISSFCQEDSIRFIQDWSRCGLTQSFSIDGAQEYYFDEIKSDLESGISDKEILYHIFKTYPAGGIIFFHSGPYIFDSGIKIPSGFVLSGMNKESTYFIFDELKKDQDLILAQGKITKKEVAVNEHIPVGLDRFKCSDPAAFKVNDWVLLKDDDEALVTSSWAKGRSGQLMKIRRIIGDQLFFDSVTRRAYNLENSPRLVKVLPVQSVGITDITIINNQATEIQTSNVQFRYAVDCFVSNIASRNSNYAHVLLEYAANCMVLDSDFKDGHSYGAGGKAYGVVLQFATSECLIKGNRFEHLRHSMLVQAGANGNLFTENESTDPYWKEPFLPKRSSGDLVLHGNYPYYNLFSDNKIQNLVIDKSHGKSGPNNFFIGNEIQSYGIVMTKKAATDSCYFINNTISEKGMMKGKYRIRGEGHTEKGNLVKGKLRPKVE